MPDRYTRRILEHIGHDRYRPMQIRRLARELNIPDDELDLFREAVEQLEDDGQVVIGSSDEVSLPPPGREMIGVIRVHPRGFAFIVPDSPTQHGDLFVPQGNTNEALTGDRVRAKVIHQKGRAGGGRSPYIGRVVEIIQRAERQYVGTLSKRGSQFIVEVDGRFLHDPIIIRDPHAKDAKEGDKVAIELIEYPSGDDLGEGVIIEVLGDAGEPHVETLGVMRAYGLVEKFEQHVLDDARRAAKKFDDKKIPKDRVDLTDRFILTIDPPDARDFDDAINLDELNPRTERDNAAYELGVHIADVSHFVEVGSALDEEAFVRGNSAYLPRKVVPMLPELLSNGVCSLQEGVHRYTKSCFIRYDDDGRVVGSRFCRSVIKSRKRLTYLEAQALIDDDLKEARRHTRSEPNYPKELIDTVKRMDELARKIRKCRLEDGMIVLGLPEVELIYDEAGRVVDAEPEDDAFTHTIIEMFMVAANEAAARLFDTLDVPMVRRIHPDPPVHDMTDLRQFVRVAGYNIPSNPTRRELQTLLDSVRGKPAQQAVHMAVLRTLSQAEYSPLLIGHFALASEHYTHFTSPIRRYPDLIVHRALDAYCELHKDHLKQPIPGGKARKKLSNELKEHPRVPDENRLVEMSRHCSSTERNAEAAERDLRNYLVLELLAEHLGDDFDGTVTGVTGSGVFIQLDRFLVDGFIPTAEIASSYGNPRDFWRFNRQTGALVAERSGEVIAIGDTFVVRVAKVDSVRRKMELVIVSGRGGKGVADGKTKGGKSKGKGDKSKGKSGGGKGGGGKSRSTKRRQPAGARKAHGKTMKMKRQKNKSKTKRKRR